MAHRSLSPDAVTLTVAPCRKGSAFEALIVRRYPEGTCVKSPWSEQAVEPRCLCQWVGEAMFHVEVPHAVEIHFDRLRLEGGGQVGVK